MKSFELLAHLYSLGLELEAKGDDLVCKARPDTLTTELRSAIRQHKAELLHILHRSQRKGRTPSIPRADRSQPLPLSFAQQRLWFLDQLDPKPTATYNVPFALRLTGPLNHPALAWSLDEIRRRHEALRTRFVNHHGEPLQRIDEPAPFPLTHIDLAARPPAEREAELESVLRQEAHRPFSLSEGPLVRATLVRLAATEHRLLVVLHHIISDGWSLSVFENELWPLYQAHRSGRPSPLPPLPMQYADYARWQRAQVAGASLDRELGYWKEQLAGALPVLALPTDHPRPARQSFRGDKQTFSLSPRLTAALHALSRQEGATLFMTLLAAFQILLHRYGGQDDILVGSPVANRNRVDLEGLIGFFVNTLVLRTDVSGDPSFRDVLARVRKVAVEAFAHQDMPFEKLVEAMQPERDLGYNPLFQVLFVLQNTPKAAATLPELTVQHQEIHSEVAKFDLALSMVDAQDGLQGMLEYNTDLFEPETIERMVGHFMTMLEAIVADPDQHLSHLPLLTEAQARRLLVEWNPTKTADPPDACIHTMFEAQAARTPDAVALVFEDQRLTYRALNERANQLAHHLIHLGIVPETIVGLCLERSPEMIVGLLGILKAGGAYLPLDPSYPEDRLRFMMEDAALDLIVTRKALLNGLGGHPTEVVCVDADADLLSGAPVTNPERALSSQQLAYVIYTSGSTGVPKGVLVEHGGVCNLAHAQSRAFGVRPESRVLQFASLNFDASISEIVMAFGVGATLVLPRPDAEEGNIAAYLRDHRVSVATLPPSLLAVLPEHDLPALEAVISAGEACTAPLVSRWAPGRRFYNAYGPTEATVCATIARCEAETGLPSIGRPMDHVQVYILDQRRAPVPVGVPGELYIGGAGVARGYLNRPTLTAERFVPDPFSAAPDARLYKTGDLARYLPDGAIAFLGRRDHQVKLRGFRIELGEIEEVLSAHPQVRQQVAVVREERPGDPRLVAYVVPDHETDDLGKTLRRYLEAKLPGYMVPAHILVQTTLPLTPNGKVDRKALPAPDTLAAPREQTYRAPRTHTEETLTDLWTEVLGVDHIGIDDNFFDLGGHSLLTIKLLTKINRAFGKKLAVAHLFNAPTIARLARVIQQDVEAGSWKWLMPLHAEGSRPPLFCIHGISGSANAFRHIANHLDPDQPVYSLQGQGLQGERITLGSVPEIAAQYVEEITTLRPEGPYLLIAHCAGGHLALEVAQQLRARGKEVALLAFIDLLAPNARATGCAASARRASAKLTALRTRGMSHLASRGRKHLLYRLRRGSVWLKKTLARGYAALGRPVPVSCRMIYICETYRQTLLSYTPQRYEGPLTLFRTDELEKFGHDLGWSGLAAGGLRVCEVPGKHMDVFREPGVSRMAQHLEGMIRDALAP